MRNYFKILLEAKNRVQYADQCLSENIIGIDYGVQTNLADSLSETQDEFKNQIIGLYLQANPDKSRSAKHISDLFWSIFNEIEQGDIIVCPNGRGTLYFGEVVSQYFYTPDSVLPHRRSVKWLPATFKRVNISNEMKESLKVKSTSLLISQHAGEIEKYINEYVAPASIIKPDSERHLEDLIVENWGNTLLGKDFDIYEEDGELVGQQYPTNTGPIDILAVSKDRKELLVVELKKGRASNVVVGQIQRYMGFVQQKLAKDNQVVRGIIIASEEYRRIQNALLVTRNIEFYRYYLNIEFKKG